MWIGYELLVDFPTNTKFSVRSCYKSYTSLHDMCKLSESERLLYEDP